MTESFAQLFEESLASQRIRPGQILTGRVIEIGPDVVLVSAGLKSEAVIPTQQFKNDRGEIEVSVGDEVEVALDSVECRRRILPCHPPFERSVPYGTAVVQGGYSQTEATSLV